MRWPSAMADGRSARPLHRRITVVGGTVRSGKTVGVPLASGDVIAFGEGARLAYHGIDRIRPGTSRLVPGGGRISLTLRRVTVRDPRGGR